MNVLLVTQYSNEIINNGLPNNALLINHFNLYHKAVYNALKSLGHNVLPIQGTERNLEKLIIKSDIVFPIKHDYGYIGGDYNLVCLCKKNNIPFIGCSPYTKLFDTDKIAGKLLCEKLKIKTPKYYLPYLINEANLKDSTYLWKPRFSASSKELNDSNIYSKKDLLKKINYFLDKEKYFVEEYIEGMTASIGCVFIDNDNILVSNPYALKSKEHKIITYEDKKNRGCTTHFITDFKVKRNLIKYAEKIFKSIQPCIMARIDFIYTESKELYFLEINTTPTLNPENSFVKSLIEKYFISYEKFLSHLINISISFSK